MRAGEALTMVAPPTLRFTMRAGRFRTPNGRLS